MKQTSQPWTDQAVSQSPINHQPPTTQPIFSSLNPPPHQWPSPVIRAVPGRRQWGAAATFAVGALDVEAEDADGRHLLPVALGRVRDELVPGHVHLQLTEGDGRRRPGRGGGCAGRRPPPPPPGTRRQRHPVTAHYVRVDHKPDTHIFKLFTHKK